MLNVYGTSKLKHSNCDFWLPDPYLREIYPLRQTALFLVSIILLFLDYVENRRLNSFQSAGFADKTV
jgi:hypothetical protein